MPTVAETMQQVRLLTGKHNEADTLEKEELADELRVLALEIYDPDEEDEEDEEDDED